MYVDWPNAVIKVFKTDMVLVEPAPPAIKPIYQLDTNWFRLQLKDMEDDEQGMAWPDTHRHNTTVEVSGAILARVVEIINGYTVEFEDDGGVGGQYAVNLVGSNNNIADVTVVNQVSIRPSNSAGLQDLNSLQAASFDGVVALKPSSSFSGTVFPVGTRGFPVNSLYDALAIATERGIRQIAIMESMTLFNGDWSSAFTFIGDNLSAVTLTVDPAADVTNCEFQNMTVQGTLDGDNIVRDCVVLDLNYVQGYVVDSALRGVISVAPGSQASIFDCKSDVAGGGTDQHADIDLGGTGSLALRNFSGGVAIRNYSGTGDISCDFLSGRCIVEDTVTAGHRIYIRGVCDVDDQTDAQDVHDLTINKDTEITAAAALEAQAQQTMIRKLATNRVETDPDTGIMTVYDDDGITVFATTTIWEDIGGTVPYKGEGLERQDALLNPKLLLGSRLDGWYQPTEFYQDDAGIVLATAVDDPVRMWKDSSVNNKHLGVWPGATVNPSSALNTGPGDYLSVGRNLWTNFAIVGSLGGLYLPGEYQMNQGYTVVMVHRTQMPYTGLVQFWSNTFGDVGTLYSSDPGSNPYVLTHFAKDIGSSGAHTALQGPGDINSPFVDDNVWRVMAFRVSTDQSEDAYWVGDTKYDETNVSTQPAEHLAGDLICGSASQNLVFFDCMQFAEIVVGVGFVTDDEVQVLIEWARQKHNL